MAVMFKIIGKRWDTSDFAIRDHSHVFASLGERGNQKESQRVQVSSQFLEI